MWANIPDFDGYEVSAYGQVYSHKSQRLLSIQRDKRGYLKTTISKHSKNYPVFIHRLVALAHIPNPNSLSSVNHKDGNKLNNHISNLEWMSNRDNTRHAITELKNHRSVVNRKATPELLKKVMELRSKGLSYKAISNEVGINQHTLNSAVNIHVFKRQYTRYRGN